MSYQRGWYFVSITRKGGDSIRVDSRDVDAVYSDTRRGAVQEARRRNPLKPNQDVTLRRAMDIDEERRALEVMEKRNKQVAELRTLVEKS